ncbi:MAG: 6-phosphogluconolactonase [Ilumatobacteraceae bacterium]
MSQGLSTPHATEDDAAQASACDIVRHLEEAYRTRGRSVLTVCGGRSVALVLRHLRLAHPVTVIATDERCVPLDSPERNDRALIDHFGESAVIRAPHSDDPRRDAEEWAARLWQMGTPDVALLSMADDGHVASLFPRRSTLDSQSPVVIEWDSPKPPSVRVSLSAARIRCIPHRLVLAIGRDKAAMIDQIRQGHDVPATRIKPTRWYLDSAASSANGGGR